MSTIKYFHSSMTGAPVLLPDAGTLIAILDACLVTGFGLKTVDSLTVSGGVATATFSTGHSFEVNCVAQIAGADIGALNGDKTVLETTTNTIKFAAPGVADGTVTGTMTAKIAPAGWAKPFSGTNLAVYRSQDVTGTRHFLRVSDPDGRCARVLGYENMTDVNTGTGRFPVESQRAGGGYWPKCSNTTSVFRAWTLFADSRGFWLHVHSSGANQGSNGSIVGFGDIKSLKAGDPYSCALWSQNADLSASGSATVFAVEHTNPSGQEDVALARSFTGLGGSTLLRHYTEGYFTSGGISGNASSSGLPAYPNGPDNSLILVRKYLSEQGVCMRGFTRGVYFAPQNCHAQFNWRDIIDGQGPLLGRKLMAVKCGAFDGQGSTGVVFFDITGPWE